MKKPIGDSDACYAWNPACFGDTPRQREPSGQFLIFWDDSIEPPEPDDFDSVDEFHAAWDDWTSSNPDRKLWVSSPAL